MILKLASALREYVLQIMVTTEELLASASEVSQNQNLLNNEISPVGATTSLASTTLLTTQQQENAIKSIVQIIKKHQF